MPSPMNRVPKYEPHVESYPLKSLSIHQAIASMEYHLPLYSIIESPQCALPLNPFFKDLLIG